MKYKFGKQARTFNPKVPHMSALLAALKLPPVPDKVDWTKGIKDFGMMLNDELGDCTCAAVFHARQIWTANTITEQTEPDADVLALYEAACGYKPHHPSTDNGGIEQNVLTYLLNEGIPLKDGTRDKILAFVEVDPRNIDDIKRTIWECGVCYIGFGVPSNLFDPTTGEPPAIWKLDPKHESIEGGHAIVLVGYDEVGFKIISWGSVYTMSYDFFTHYTDEAYAISDPSWFAATGKTPCGLAPEELEQLMAAIKAN